MSEKRFHAKSHGRLHVNVDVQLTETEILINRIQTLETMLHAIDEIRWPELYKKVETRLNDAKADLEAKRIIEWLGNESECIHFYDYDGYEGQFPSVSEPDYDAQAEWHLEQKFGEPVHS